MTVRVVLFAWCATGTSYLDALALAGAPPVLVVTGGGTRAEGVLGPACARMGSPLAICEDVREDALFDRVASCAPDLLLVTGCPQRLPARLLSLPGLGAVNVHPSLLPHYRGREPLFWALLRGEARVGVSAHRMTEAIDAGPVLLQRAIDVPPRATSATLAREADEAGASLVAGLVARARGGDLGEGWTCEEAGSAFPPLRAEHGLVDWSRSAVELDRLVRAAEGAIDAYAFVVGMRVIVREAEPVTRPAGHLPGAVIAIAGDDLVIATSDGALACKRFVFLRRARTGRELAADLAIAVGDRFASSPAF